MAQLSFYVSEEVEEKIKKEAKKSGKTVSAYLADLVKSHIVAPMTWPPNFFESIAGKWIGDFPEIEELPLKESDVF